MTYEDPEDARQAIREFDGANANGKRSFFLSWEEGDWSKLSSQASRSDCTSCRTMAAVAVVVAAAAAAVATPSTRLSCPGVRCLSACRGPLVADGRARLGATKTSTMPLTEASIATSLDPATAAPTTAGASAGVAAPADVAPAPGTRREVAVNPATGPAAATEGLRRRRKSSTPRWLTTLEAAAMTPRPLPPRLLPPTMPVLREATTSI